MNEYILNRLRADAAHVLKLAQNEGTLQHQGIKGRFRELLINNVLQPWLPPYISCGTGMIIAQENQSRQSTQDDVIIYDKSLTPPILVSPQHAPEGIYLYNSVIARIEVKSKVTRADIAAFVRSSKEISQLKHSVQPGFTGLLEGTYNFLFAFDSDARGNHEDYQLKRLIEVMQEENVDPLSGIVSMLCIPPYGFWKIGISNGRRIWQRLSSSSNDDRIVWFVGCLSNSCYAQHAKRQGRDPAVGLEGGIGMYLSHPFEDVKI